MKVTGLDKVLENIKKMGTEGGFRAAVIATYGETVDRIFKDGKASDGTTIGDYSTEPIYVNPDKSPRKFTPLGKNKKSKFKNGKKKKTRYFPTGYAGFRKKAGRNSPTVNLLLTGNLRASFQLQSKGKPPFKAEFLSELSAEIADGNEERFDKKIFEMTDEEVENLVRRTLEFSKTN